MEVLFQGIDGDVDNSDILLSFFVCLWLLLLVVMVVCFVVVELVCFYFAANLISRITKFFKSAVTDCSFFTLRSDPQATGTKSHASAVR